MKTKIWIKTEARYSGSIYVMSDKEHDEKRAKVIKQIDDTFYEWLADNYSIFEIWDATEEERNNILAEWAKINAQWYDDNDEYFPYEIDMTP